MSAQTATLRVAIIDDDSGFVHVLGKRLDGAGCQHRTLSGPVPAEELAAMRLNALVMMLEDTRPARYSLIEIGEPKTFRKFLVQTSSKKAIVTPNITLVKKSHIRTAPSSTGTKSKPAAVTELRYFVMKPHRMMSIATQTTSDSTRVGPARSR